MNQLLKLVILLFIIIVNSFAQDSAGNAVIFNASTTGLASDVVYFQGSGFGASPSVRYCFNDGNWASLTPLTSGDNALTVQLPADSPLPNLVEVEVSADGYNWSLPVFLNQAKALSFDTNQVAAGSSFRIFGRNLVFSLTPSVRFVDMADGSSQFGSVNTGGSTAYALMATAPASIQANHTYKVYVSNGYNGNAGSGGETLAYETLQGREGGDDYFNLGVPWAADFNFTGNVYNVQTDPRLSRHATGSGSAMDIWTIFDAITAAAKDGGGIVYLPAGTYNLYFQNGCGVTLLPRVVLMGQGAGNTFVNWGFGPTPGPGTGYGVCFAPNQSGVSDITFTNVNQGGNWAESFIGGGANEVFIQRTTWNVANARSAIMLNTSNSTIQNSTITQGVDPSYNGPLNASSSTNFVLRNNNIKFVNGAITLDFVAGGIVENNTIVRDASQQAGAGGVTHIIAANFTRDFMVLYNSFQVSGATLPSTNDGETIGSEAGGTTRYDEFRGTVQWAGSNSLTDGAQNFNWSSNNAIPILHVGSIITIVAGRGAGEWAYVSAISSDGHTVWVATPWAVQPTAGSRYATFDWSAANWIIAGNTMSDNEKGIEFCDASIRDVLITNNQLNNNSEILITPTEQPYGAGLFNVILNTQITNNTISDTNHLRPAAISIVPREDGQNTNFGTAVIGIQLSGNTISGYNPPTVTTPTSFDDSKAITEGFNVFWQWQTTWSNFQDDGTPSILGTVIQNNTLNNSQEAVYLNSGAYQTLLAGNSYNGVSQQLSDNTLPGANHASVSTVVVGAAARIVAPTAAWNQVTVGSLAASVLAPEGASVTSFTLAPSLYQFNTGSDSFSMLAEQLGSDATAIARISISTASSIATRGLVVMRGSSSPNSAFVSVGQLETGEFYIDCRPYDGGAISAWGLAVANPGTPLWVKIVKSGNVFQTFLSLDGSLWSPVIQVNSNFSSAGYLVGLESFSDTIFGPALQFDNVSVL